MKDILLITVISSGLSFCQYTAEWTSPNLGQSGWGGAYGFDIDNDGMVEIETRSSSQITFYNGNYTVAWNIPISGYDYLNVLYPRDIDGNGLLVPLNTDNDGAGELVVTCYYFSGSTYYGRFRVYDASTHSMEFESPLITGFYGSGSLEDIDGDGRDEIIINRFGSSTSESYVVVYAYTQKIDEQKDSYEVHSTFRTFPNPASNIVYIPFAIEEHETFTPLLVKIYNIAGQLVKTLMKSDNPAPGDYRLIWDGTDDNGSVVSSGTYFVSIIAGQKEYRNEIRFIRKNN
ncbi:MAG: FlgD immunoglobulin-like domain containing protein [candidate division WOR-3 bacterium]